MTEVSNQQDTLISMAEDIISVLRTSSEVESVHNIKELQDAIKIQYERYQFDAKELLKRMSINFQMSPLSRLIKWAI